MLLALVTYEGLQWVANLVFVRRAKVLEELLGARLRCRFFGVHSDVNVFGLYKGRKIQFTSLARLCRVSWFILLESGLPRQRRFLFSYPKVTQNVEQRGDTLVFVWQGSALGRPNEFERARVLAILDELVHAAEIAEAALTGEGVKPRADCQ